MIAKILQIASASVILSVPICWYNEYKRDMKIKNQLDREFMEYVIRAELDAEAYRKEIKRVN